jgi:prepilin signal peptidase PulO-like enzyme (type II secretory pathway)
LFTNFEWVMIVWLGMLGACVGSFLNVVIYRLPRGESLVRPGSRCPRCGAAIRPYHNIPVLGWLMLRGRCRDCGVRISWRYPAVEAMTGALFFALALVVFGVADAQRPAVSDVRRWGLYAGVLVAACSLISIGCILYDRQRIPRVLFVALATGLAVVAAFLWLVLT